MPRQVEQGRELSRHRGVVLEGGPVRRVRIVSSCSQPSASVQPGDGADEAGLGMELGSSSRV
jgi:hypothetical protein